MTVQLRRRPAVHLTIALAAAGVFAAACGAGSSGGSATVGSQPTAGNSSASTGVTLMTHKGPAGTYLTDAKGRSLYVFAKDTSGTSNCSGSCAHYWPPLTGASPQVASGLTASMAATTSRSDGSTQVTYNGHPLYLYIGDSKVGDTNGQGLDLSGGKWWLVDPHGAAITGNPAPTSSPSTSSGGYGGYGGYGGG
jgi:predicted lipoprotein with Yx(FWY)xxD motif